jgi:FMN phosphatase YigB (HAD superfamily)
MAYQRVLELLQLEPHECIMVAAHAYDLRAAKEVLAVLVISSNYPKDS